VLVRLEEVPGHQVRDVYKLLLDDSYAVRHAAAELVADMLEESGQRHLAQVITSPCYCFCFLCLGTLDEGSAGPCLKQPCKCVQLWEAMDTVLLSCLCVM